MKRILMPVTALRRRSMYLTLVLTITLPFVFALPVHAQSCFDGDVPVFCQFTVGPLPLSPGVTTFSTDELIHSVDYTNSGLPGSAFVGVSMQSTFQEISDADYANLVAGTPFANTFCEHQLIDGTDPACVVNIDLCTTSTNSTPSGANCPKGPANGPGIILIRQVFFGSDPTNPGYLFGTDTALSCSPTQPPSCKNLTNIFISINEDTPGDPGYTGGTKNFNSMSVPSTNVVYAFNGFFQPVDNLPSVNVAKAGSAIPVKFSLGGNVGLGIFLPGSPSTLSMPCGGAIVDDIEQTVTAGSSSLQFDPGSNQYIYVWKTDKSWAGTCRQLQVKLNDGSTQVANFRFK